MLGVERLLRGRHVRFSLRRRETGVDLGPGASGAEQPPMAAPVDPSVGRAPGVCRHASVCRLQGLGQLRGERRRLP